jgi:SWI/SNF-related matrix-associated actin-dependent regulator 1 of chromatin subfamily A
MNLYAHQKQAISFLLDRGSGILAMEMGLGKSVCAILASQKWVEPDKVTLVVCPAFLVLNWVAEWEKWTGKKPFYYASYTKQVKGDTPVLVMSYDIFRKKQDKGILYPDKVGTFICDESAYIKNYKAKRTKAVLLFRFCGHRILCSGAPIINNAVELFPQLQLANPYYWDNVWKFIAKFCNKIIRPWGTYFDQDTIRNKDQLVKEISSIMFRVRSDEIEDMPAIIRNHIEISRFEFQDTYERDIIDIARNEGRKCAIQALGKYKMALADAKADWVIKKFLKDESHAGKKILIFSMYRATTKKLADSIEAEWITGELNTKDRYALLDEFKENDKTFIFATLPSIGEGLNLGWVDEVYFNDLDYTPAKHQQGEGRLRRITRKKHVISNYFISPGTFDDFILKKLTDKQDLIDAVIDNGILRQEKQEVQSEYIDYLLSKAVL